MPTKVLWEELFVRLRDVLQHERPFNLLRWHPSLLLAAPTVGDADLEAQGLTVRLASIPSTGVPGAHGSLRPANA
jgi:hypothetical protein